MRMILSKRSEEINRNRNVRLDVRKIASLRRRCFANAINLIISNKWGGQLCTHVRAYILILNPFDLRDSRLTRTNFPIEFD